MCSQTRLWLVGIVAATPEVVAQAGEVNAPDKTIPAGRMASHRDHSDVAQASDTGLPVFADSVAASARRRASIASSMDGVGLVPATTASMNAVSSMR